MVNYVTNYPTDAEGQPLPLRELAASGGLTLWVPTDIEVSLYLGYSDNNSWRHEGRGNTLVRGSDVVATEVHRAVAWILYYEEAIQETTQDTAVSTLDKMTVDFTRQISNMYRRAAEWVEYLGNIVDVPVRVNRFKTIKNNYCLTRPV